MNAEDYRWHYDYVRLACDLGFSFHALKSKSIINQNIGHLDIEELIKDKDVATVERYIKVVVEFNLDCEQAKVLDPNFVKVFQVSQLAIQYLLFCKKYLDNTVVLIKNDFQRNNEETKNLKRYVEELKLEASNAKKQIQDLKQSLNDQVSKQNTNIFQCNDCPKAFSTEEYLLAHIKRRHEFNKEPELSKTSFQVETDKLQLEIKELKERLNNTEKFIQHDDMDVKSKYSNGSYYQKTTVENTVLTELQHKFELLKNHVENELRILQTQKFDQDKYEKWFETFLYQLSSTHGKEAIKQNKVEESQQSSVCTKCQKNERINESVKQNSVVTQTDFISTPQHKQSPICLQQVVHSYTEIDEKICSETDDRLEKFEEIIQEKMSGSIEKLENQMQSFMTKMNEIEKQTKHNKQLIITEHLPKNKKTETIIDTLYKKPKTVSKNAKPTLLSKRSSVSSDDQSLKTKAPRQKIVKTTHITLPKNSVIKSSSLSKFSDKEDLSNTDTESDSGDSTSNESSDDDDDDEDGDKTKAHNNSNGLVPTNKPSTTSTLGKRSLTSLKEVAFTPEVLLGLQKEIEHVFDNRLEELGVSPEWSSLPLRSYQRAMNIVNHQASIFQKNIPNYMQIRAQILKAIDNKIETSSRSSVAPQKYSKFKSLLGNMKSKTKSIKKTTSDENRVQVSPKKKTFEKAQNKIQTVHLTPKKKSVEKKAQMKTKSSSLQMYTTDSDTETNTKNEKSSPKKQIIGNKLQTKAADSLSTQMYATDSDKETYTKNEKGPKNDLTPEKKAVEKKSETKAENSSMQTYVTDFDTETNTKIKKLSTNNEGYKPYNDVIQELNSTLSLNRNNNKDSIPDIPNVQLENPPPVVNVETNNEQNLEHQSKSVLKSFPSNISLQKKKVLFDLESSDASATKEVEKRAVVVKTNDGGSTTSIASSILDGPKQNKEEKRIKDDDIQQLSDLSDWDISELN